jgi:hypothetical protein
MTGRLQSATCILAIVLATAVTPARAFWIINEPDGSGMIQHFATIDCEGGGLEDDYADLYQFKYNTGTGTYQAWGWTDTPTLPTNDIHADAETGVWHTTAYAQGDDYPVGNYKLSIREGETECDSVSFIVNDGM